jgi:hypothetical protein
MLENFGMQNVGIFMSFGIFCERWIYLYSFGIFYVNLVYFMPIWYILCPFGIFWYIPPRGGAFGMLCQEKSDNPRRIHYRNL